MENTTKSSLLTEDQIKFLDSQTEDGIWTSDTFSELVLDKPNPYGQIPFNLNIDGVKTFRLWYTVVVSLMPGMVDENPYKTFIERETADDGTVKYDMVIVTETDSYGYEDFILGSIEHGLTRIFHYCDGWLTMGECQDCHTTVNVTFDECPAAADLSDDHSPLWLCERCADNRGMDV
jgi:hypothetical protein